MIPGTRSTRKGEPHARADARMEAPDPRLGLCADEIRAGTPHADPRLRPTAWKAWLCACGTSTAPGQALSNPYTGVLAIFSSRLHNGQPPMIFEDGRAAPRLRTCGGCGAGLRPRARPREGAGRRVHVGSGEDRSVTEVARLLSRAMGKSIAPEIAGKARIGDIRHCIADIAKIRDELGMRPSRDFPRGSRRTRRMGRQARKRRIASRRRAGSSKREASWHERADATIGAPAVLRRRPVLVTGGAGFIGSNLADRFASEGHDVLIYDALARPGVERNLAWLKRRHP